MIDLDLRRQALEADGWRLGSGLHGGWWHSPKCIRQGKPYCNTKSHVKECDLPAVEHDPAAAIELLIEFCAKRKVHWEIGTDMIHEGKFTCLIAALDAETCAETIAEAICRAVIAARKEKR